MAKNKKLQVLKKRKISKIKLIGELASDFSKSNFMNSKIELNFNKQAVVEECRGVSDYGDTRIVLNVKGGVIVFEGTELTLHSYENSTAVIRGSFTNISYEI